MPEHTLSYALQTAVDGHWHTVGYARDLADLLHDLMHADGAEYRIELRRPTYTRLFEEA